MALIQLRGVSRTYDSTAGAVHALCDVDLTIERGDFVAVVGPSGGGKTTLLSIIGGLDTPTAGEYVFDGEPMPKREGRRLAAIRSRAFAFIFQGFHLLEQRPASDSISLGMLYQGVPAKERRRRAARAASQVGMAERIDELTARLSGGQRQRLAIARAIATRSPVLLADEPTGNLDSATGARVMDELRLLHEAGVTIVVVTHSSEVAAAASRVVRISDGRLTEERAGAPASPASMTAPRDDVRARPREAFADMMRDAVASVLSRTRQSFALAATVGLAIALLVTTIGMSESTRAQVVATFDAHTNREVTVAWSPDDPAATLPTPAAAVKVATETKGVDAAAVVTDYVEVAVGNMRGDAFTVNVHDTAGDLAGATRTDIDWLGAEHLLPGEALIGQALARQLELGPIEGGPVITVAGVEYRVRGVVVASSRLPSLAGDVVLADGDAPEVLTADRRSVLLLTQPGAALQIGARIPLALDPYTPEAFDVHVPTDPRTLRAEVEGGVQVSLLAFTAVSALVAILTLMNTIGAAVNARRAELGLRRALGARSGQLAGLVMTESAVIGAVGGIGGLIAGFVAILGFTIAQHWMPVFDVRLAPLAVVAGVGIGCFASLVGAVRAARVRPADALRQ